mgnify:CR=1 FL=1
MPSFSWMSSMTTLMADSGKTLRVMVFPVSVLTKIWILLEKVAVLSRTTRSSGWPEKWRKYSSGVLDL